MEKEITQEQQEVWDELSKPKLQPLIDIVIEFVQDPTGDALQLKKNWYFEEWQKIPPQWRERRITKEKVIYYAFGVEISWI